MAFTEESTSRYIQLDDMRLHYHDAGEGEAIIMLHGGGPGASGWGNYKANIGPLAEKGYRVIAPDLPGFNKSDPIVTAEPRRVVAARAVKQLMDALGIEKAHLVGNSLGGQIAVGFTLDYPERVDKLIIMGSSSFAGKSMFTPLPSEGGKSLFRLYRNPTMENLKFSLELFVYDQSLITEELIQERWEAINYLDGIHLKNFLKSEELAKNGGMFEDISHRVKEIKNPTLLIWGRDDRFAPLDIGVKLLWEFPNARLHVFSGCGHWAQFEKKDEFNRLVLDFVSH